MSKKHEPHFSCVRCAEHFTYPAEWLRQEAGDA